MSQRNISFPPYERMKALYPEAHATNSQRLIKAMEPIIQTASYVMEQIIQGGIEISDLKNGTTLAAKVACIIHLLY